MVRIVAKKVEIEGFKDAQETVNRRLIVSIEAVDKEGKTEFALGGPKPMAYINMDIGLEMVIDKHVKARERIVIAEFDVKDATLQAEHLKMWEGVKKAHYSAVGNPEIRTIVWDTETEMWELLRLARFGKVTSPGANVGMWYGPINAEIRDMIRKVYTTNKNMIMTHKLKDRYVNNACTGELERAGFKETRGLAQVNLRSFRNRKTGTFAVQVVNCRPKAELMGEVYEEPMNSFTMLACEIFPETSPETWE
jgi:hypothetical protein